MGHWRNIMAKSKQAEFSKYLGPVLDALKELGGSGRPKEVTDKVAKNLNISDKIREETLKNGSSKWDNQVAWARQYLVYAGLIDNSKKGVWVLTPLGQNTTLDEKQGHEIFLNHVARIRNIHKGKINVNEIEEIETDTKVEKEETLLEVLRSITPIGFEHLCQRVLREIGFENVEITQRSHDEGIDGFGTLKLNPLISLKIIFQCKRYKKTVSREKIGDFRNAVIGRAEKGIMITTGTFSGDAKKEANRDGAIPIELIDGERLVELFEELELGVKPVTKYEIDYNFFEEYYNIK
jgi:restriction system protein